MRAYAQRLSRGRTDTGDAIRRDSRSLPLNRIIAQPSRSDMKDPLEVSEPSDVQEQEARRASDAAVGAPERRSTYAPLAGWDLSKVRVHTDSRAAAAADALNARAFTMGNDIIFGAGQYQPSTTSGRRLLAHELAHVAQQSTRSRPAVQRDLKAYNQSRSEVLPTFDFSGSSFSSLEMTAEAPAIRNALRKLITAGKIKEVRSADGHVSWFAAEHHKNAQLAEIQDALRNAGFAKADALGRAIYDIHGEYLYSSHNVTTIAAFWNDTRSLGEKLETETNRSMTEWEIGQARRVFGSAIKYSDVTMSEGSLSAKVGALGGYARTVGNTIFFPAGKSREMSFIVHELTHIWQYQTTGWTYAPKALWAQMTEGYSYSDNGKSPEQSLRDGRAAGKTLFDYNKEQQGDILSDYYRRLQMSADTSAWQPFVDDI